jgi:hypothetical protein
MKSAALHDLSLWRQGLPRWGEAMVVNERTSTFSGLRRLIMYRESSPLGFRRQLYLPLSTLAATQFAHRTPARRVSFIRISEAEVSYHAMPTQVVSLLSMQ